MAKNRITMGDYALARLMHAGAQYSWGRMTREQLEDMLADVLGAEMALSVANEFTRSVGLALGYHPLPSIKLGYDPGQEEG